MTLWGFIETYPFYFYFYGLLLIVVASYGLLALALRVYCKVKSYKDAQFVQPSWIAVIVEDRYGQSLLLFLLAIISIVFPVVFLFFKEWEIRTISKNISDWGAVGDFFGGMLNPIFAFASFMALLYTINIQSKQLNVSTKELEATRKELAEAAKAQNKSSKALESQMHLSMVQNSEALFYKAHKKLLVDIGKVQAFRFSVKYYSGKGTVYDQKNELLYRGINRDNAQHLTMNYNFFLNFYKTKHSNFSIQDTNFHKLARFHSGKHAIPGANGYVIENTLDFNGLVELFALNSGVFDNLILSLNYALNAAFDLSNAAQDGKDFSLFYYSYIKEAIDDDLLIFVCLCLRKSFVISHTILSEFKFFERLKIDKDGFIANGLLHVSDFNLPHRSFGNNENYGLFKAAAKSVDVC